MGKNGGGGGGGERLSKDIMKDLWQSSKPINRQMSNMFQQFLGLPGGSYQMQTPEAAPGAPPPGQVQMPGSQTRDEFDMGLQPQRQTLQGPTPGPQEVWVPNEGPGKPWDPTASPLWAPGKLAAEQAYGTARENILSSMPAGGGMTAAFGDLEKGRANQLTNLTGQIGADMWDKVFSFGTGQPQSALTGATNLAGIQAQQQTAENAAKMGKMGDIGMGAGMLAM